MKKIIIFLLSFFVCCVVGAQTVSDSPLIFSDNFKKGTVYMKDKTKATAYLNYNALSEEMVFIDFDDKEVKTMLEPQKVAYIAIENRTFEPLRNNTFVEKIKLDNGEYYVEWKAEAIKSGKNIGYGNYSATAATTNVTQVLSSYPSDTNVASSMTADNAAVNQYMVNERVEVNQIMVPYLKKDGRLKKINSAKSLTKLFDENYRANIESYISKNNLKFDNQKDLAKILEYSFDIAK